MHRFHGFSVLCVALLFAALSLGACSPYVYKDEVAAFGSGVDDSVQAFQALKPQYTAWATEQRDTELIEAFQSSGAKPLTSDGCEKLQQRYNEAFNDHPLPDADLLSAEVYADCHLTPLPTTDPKEGLPNLDALGTALTNYAAGLVAVTDAGDEAALEEAFGKFNTSAKALLKAVNEESARKNQEAFDEVGTLVYQAGLAYLRQRRFDALKEAVNDSHPVVARAAALLAEASYFIYNPTLIGKKQALEAAERKAATVTESNYVQVWSEIDEARTNYVRGFQGSPIYAFAKIEATHEALRDSLNDPANRAQLEALYDEVVALRTAAKAALEAVRKNNG